MGAAYSSLGRTKVLYATSLVLLGAKAKLLPRLEENVRSKIDHHQPQIRVWTSIIDCVHVYVV